MRGKGGSRSGDRLRGRWDSHPGAVVVQHLGVLVSHQLLSVSDSLELHVFQGVWKESMRG